MVMSICCYCGNNIANNSHKCDNILDNLHENHKFYIMNTTQVKHLLQYSSSFGVYSCTRLTFSNNIYDSKMYANF